MARISFVDINNTVITKFVKNSDNYIRVTAENSLNTTKKVNVYVVAYDETGTMINVQKVIVSVPAGKRVTAEDLLVDETTMGKAAEYKVLAWNDDMNPLLAAYKIDVVEGRDRDTYVKVSGVCKQANEKVALIVVKKDLGYDNLSEKSDDDCEDMIYEIDQTTSDENGNYVFRFRIEDPVGEYMIKVREGSNLKLSELIGK